MSESDASSDLLGGGSSEPSCEDASLEGRHRWRRVAGAAGALAFAVVVLFGLLGKWTQPDVDPDIQDMLVSAAEAPGVGPREGATLEASFELRALYNCFPGSGGEALVGKVPAGIQSVATCKQACAREAECVAAVAPHGANTGSCWLLSHVDLPKCQRDLTWDLWMKRAPRVDSGERGPFAEKASGNKSLSEVVGHLAKRQAPPSSEDASGKVDNQTSGKHRILGQLLQVKQCLSQSLRGASVEYPYEHRYLQEQGDQQLASQAPPYDPVADSSLWTLHNRRVAAKQRPLAVVYARNIQDVREATMCAVEAQVPVMGQSGRHSYLAYCLEDCMLVNTYLMKDYTIHERNGTAVLGAGLNLGQAYTYLDKAGFTIPGGSCPTVGLAGLTLGGGKGILTRKEGMLIDKLIGLDAVLSNGSIVHASAESHSDLLWLAKGGGGNTFPGVVTAFQFKLVRRPEFITEWAAKWPIICKSAKCSGREKALGVAAVEVWQNLYLNHPDRRVYVRLEIHPYEEMGLEPHVYMAFRFIGMTREEAEPYTLPALRELGPTANNDGLGLWETHPYIVHLQRNGGIGMQALNRTCKTWEEGLTESEAEAQMTMAQPAMCSWMEQKSNPTCAGIPKNDWTVPFPSFCAWDSGFVTNMLYRALVMTPMSKAAIEELMRFVVQAPYFDMDKAFWNFYLQIDPSNGAAGDVPPEATAYPWRGREHMTMQVIAKWDGTATIGSNPTLEAFNFLLISVMQPFVGTRSYYNYADNDMPGGAIPLFSYFGKNAGRVLEIRHRYADMRTTHDTEWELVLFRENEPYGMQEWLDMPEATHLGDGSLQSFAGAQMVKKMESLHA